MEDPPVIAGPASGEVTNEFRRELYEVLPFWQNHGYVSEFNARRLSQAYRLSDFAPEQPKPDLAVSEPPDTTTLGLRVAFLVGGLLLGFGVIAFIAANWTHLTGLGKAALLNGGVLSLYLGGYYLWFKKAMPGIGHSMILAGALAFGADLGLMAQGFNVSLPYFAGYGAWSLGVLALAVALRSVPLTVLSLLISPIWLFGSLAHMPPEWFFPRFIAAAAVWAIAARMSGFRWLYPISLLTASFGCFAYVVGASQHWGWSIACLVAISSVLGAVAAALKPKDEASHGPSLYSALAWMGLIGATSVIALMRLGSLDPSGPSAEGMAPGGPGGAWLVGVLYIVAAVTFLLGGSRSWSHRELGVAGGVVASQVLAHMAAFGHGLNLPPPAAALFALLSGIVLGASMLYQSADEGASFVYASAVLGLSVFAFFGAVYCGFVGGRSWVILYLVALAVVLLALASRAAPDELRAGAKRRELAGGAWFLLGATAFVASFHWLWEPAKAVWNDWGYSAVLATLLLALATVVTGGRAVVSLRQISGRRLPLGIWLLLSATSLAGAAIASYAGAAVEVPTGLSILASGAFGAFLVGVGLAAEMRPYYWLGSSYLTFAVLVRFFEYETSNLVKSVAFTLSGIVILAAGSYYERRHRHHGGRHAH